MSVRRRSNISEQERVDTIPHAVPVAQPPTTSGVTAVAARTHGLSTRPLFRQEVLEFQQAGREWGRVLPIQPLPTRRSLVCLAQYWRQHCLLVLWSLCPQSTWDRLSAAPRRDGTGVCSATGRDPQGLRLAGRCCHSRSAVDAVGNGAVRTGWR